MTAVEELRDLGRGATGALVLGTPFLLTMETWWFAWTGRPWLVLCSAVGALLVITGLARLSGFKKKDTGTRPPGLEWLAETTGIVLQSVVAAYVVLLSYGLLRWNEPWSAVVRVGLVELIALGIGAALANDLFQSKGKSAERRPFPAMIGIFSLGALFFVLHLAPTDEIPYLAAQAGWWRLAVLLTLALLVGHLILFELEFKGHESRTKGRSPLLAWGESFLVLFLALAVSAASLAAFGQFLGQPPDVWIQQTVALALPATVGGSAARVVIA